MGLKKYIQKRDFRKTSEPRGKVRVTKHKLPTFVVQKHAASHLHFDLRIEHEGVLKSWAVPKRPSADPEEKRLAVQVEDHPLEYGKFSGKIPQGQYGAGNVEIWDKGNYTYPGETDPVRIHALIAKGFAKGHLVIEFRGNKLKGNYSLVKFKTKEKNTWLLFKMRDDFAELHLVDDTFGRDQRTEFKSVLDQLKPMKLKPFKTEGSLQPMLASQTDKAFTDDKWIFEMKYDGYRIIADINSGKVKLTSRNGYDFTTKYSSITHDLERLPFQAVIDGEVVILDKDGRPNFQELQDYPESTNTNLVYYAFDLLSLDNLDLRELSLLERKQFLKRILPELNTVKFAEHVSAEGTNLFDQLSEHGIEGMICKKADSIYRNGIRSKDWLKVKTGKEIDALVLGWKEPNKNGMPFSSLVLGAYQDRQLVYIGNVGSGFSSNSMQTILKQLQKIKTTKSQVKLPASESKGINWVKPFYTATVNYTELTKESHLRHPVFHGLFKLVNKKIGHINQATAKVPLVGLAKTQETIIKVNNRKVKITHPDKIYWPKPGLTKGQMIGYYRSVSKLILPYLHDRPVTMHRYPDGVDQEGFFHKDLEEHPSWVKTLRVHSNSAERDLHYILVQDEATLLYMANLGTVEIHPWHSRKGSLDNPDYCIFDLDPHGIDFSEVVKTALVLKGILDELEIPSAIKTTGFTGLHIGVPLGAKYTYKVVQQFMEIIQHILLEKLPDTTSIIRDPDQRPNRIYLDILQNLRGQTIVAPYSLRPGEDATVSTPLEWKEVTKNLNPKDYTMTNVLKRFEQKGDLWSIVLEKGIDLKKILAKLGKMNGTMLK